MGLGRTILVCGGVAFAAMTYQGTKSYIDSTAGKGTFDAGVHYGTQSASQNFSEVPTAANDFVAANKKPVGDLLHQGTSALGSVTGGTTATSTAARTDEGDATATTVAP